MNDRNILNEIFERKVTIEQADELLASILSSPEAGRAESLLMMTRPEWTAHVHGATFEELASWRYLGWPSQCMRCGREIEVANFGWKVVDVDGVSVLRHIQCPNLADIEKSSSGW